MKKAFRSFGAARLQVLGDSVAGASGPGAEESLQQRGAGFDVAGVQRVAAFEELVQTGESLSTSFALTQVVGGGVHGFSVQIHGSTA